LRLRKAAEFLGDDEAVLFADAVHPTHAARPAGCWRQNKRSSRSSRRAASTHQHSRRDRPADRANPDDRALTIDAASTIRLLQSIERSIRCWRSSMCSWTTRVIIMQLVQEWLHSRTTHQAALHPNVLPHLNPIERLWGSCTETSRTTSATQLAPNSPMQRSVSASKGSGNWRPL